MLFALETPGSSFKPSLRRPKNTWRLTRFKEIYNEKRSRGESSQSSLGAKYDFEISFD